MPHIPCKICSKIFYSKPSWIKKGGGKYCSIDCSSKARMKGKVVKCSTCNNEIYKTLKAINKSESGKLFCNKQCSLEWLSSKFVGKKHPNWTNGEFSYKETLKRSNICQICILCETENKKVLIVHHIDKNRKNNTPQNLIWICRNCHFLVHNHDVENYNLLKKLKICQ